VDFYTIKERSLKNGVTEVYPDFRVGRSKDLMVRGKSFYAIWDAEKGLWSTDEYDVQRLVDNELSKYAEDRRERGDGAVHVRYMSGFSSNSWVQFCNYVSHMPDSSIQLDEKLTFSDTKVKKTDYVSKRLPYAMAPGDISAYDEMIGTLYAPEERAKLEWAIGAVLAGDARNIQKFIVLYGPMGTGKSTVIRIIEKLFQGYWTTFEAKALVSSSNAFSTEVFRSNPLVAIQHDGDLSKIEDNTKLNSIVSHEEMTMNEKYKPSYTARVNCFLFLGTNKPVRITDAKSGIIRRLINVSPTGKKLPPKRYHALNGQIEFELGAIAQHCLDTYRQMGKYYYEDYRPMDMIFQTDTFFNFVEAYYDNFKKEDGVSLGRAYDMYKTYCDEALVDFKLPRHKFREELKNYFKTFSDVTRLDNGKQVRSWYSGFETGKFERKPKEKEPEKPLALIMDQTESLLDQMLADCPAQYAYGKDDKPEKAWDNVLTKLSDIITTRVHYVLVQAMFPNLICIDFDLRDENGNKDQVRNLEAASAWPPTYAEYSKSGAGIHLYYIYDGDVGQLSCIYDEGIEVKVFTGKQSLRRKLSYCNNVPVATIRSGLPLKEKKVIQFDGVKSEMQLRSLVIRALNKEIPPFSTKPAIDFIDKILSDAYKSGMVYDLTDLRPKVLVFANNSTHQASYCVKKVSGMKFSSEVMPENKEKYESDDLVFFDCEVFPNLLLVNYKYAGTSSCVRLINPEPADIEKLFHMKLVGFNCRRYDNHILYARYIGYSIEDIYTLSQRIIKGSKNAMFSQAYDISYTDVLDFSSKKQSLKLFEIELGIHHLELGLPWDQPVDPKEWSRVAEYCDNDVFATEAVFNARKGDFVAREILAELAGMTVNDTTNSLTTRIIFGKDKNPQSKFNYRNLGDTTQTCVELFGDRYSLFADGKPVFPGYTFENGVSRYRDMEVGEGGLVWAAPGMYRFTTTFDVMSMHPSTIRAENLFGPYTDKFNELLDVRAAIKHKDFDKVRTMMDGKLAKYMDDPGLAKNLSQALKIAINSVYGLTAASFENPFRDPRNKDNIVAKRGALFMCNLLHAVQDRGGQVVHIKTDSIKVVDPSPELVDFIMEYGKAYGYTFEVEHKFDRICLVNDAVYIAHCAPDDPEANDEDLKKQRMWTATGKQFQVPYIFKTLFSKEPIQFDDLCETRTVTTALYLDCNERLPEGEHSYHFVGKAGSFCPVKDGEDGGLLLREKDGKYSFVSRAKGRRWMEAETIRSLNWQEKLDRSYYQEMADEAKAAIAACGDYEWFVDVDTPPWQIPCGDHKYSTCFDCPRFGNCVLAN